MADNNLASSSAFCPSISKILPKAASMLAFSPETLMMMTIMMMMMMMMMMIMMIIAVIQSIFKLGPPDFA